MKRSVLTSRCLLLLFIVTLLLTGCSKSKSNEQFSVKTDYQYQYYTYDNICHMNACEDEHGNLYYMNGFYVYKYDVKSGANKALCNKQNCLHDREKDRSHMKECNAYFPYQDISTYERTTIAYDDGYVYIAFDSIDSYRSILRISIDGSERELIHTIKDSSVTNDIFHRGVYYYTSDTYDKNNVETMSVKAYCLDGGSREKTVYTFPNEMKGKKGYPLGINDYMAYGNHLYFLALGNIGKNTRYDKELCYNIQTGDITEIKTPDKTDNEMVFQVTFFDGRLFFYTEKKIGDQVYVYSSALDGTDVKRTSIKIPSGSSIYSDGDYLLTSDDILLWTKDLDARKHVSPDKAEYRVYDKNLKLIDTYSEDIKDNMRPVTDSAAWYYVPIGVGENSYFVKRNFNDGTCELYGGSKKNIGHLNGSHFPRKKLAEVKQSPAVKQYISEANDHPVSIYLDGK